MIFALKCVLIILFLFLCLGTSMVISGISVFFIYLLDNKTQSLIMSCVFSAISVIGWNSLDVLQAELFPTNLRSVLMLIIIVCMDEMGVKLE